MRAIVSLGLILALTLAAASAAAAQPLGGPSLALHSLAVGSRQSAAPSHPAGCRLPTANQPLTAFCLATQTPAPGPYALLQLRGPVTAADRAALERAGVTLLEYLPDFAFLVRGSPAQIAAAAALPQVAARLPFTAADKLAPALLRALAQGHQPSGPLRVLGWPGEAGALARAMRAAGLRPDTAADTTALLRIAALPAARWVEPVTQPRLLNDVARRIIRAEAAWQARGLYGAGQTIAVADSGLDTGVPATLSPDFAGRIAATHVLAEDGDLGDNLGHGTHVAGTAAGAGVQSGAEPAQHDYAGSFAGVAPEARLVIQAFETGPLGEVIGLDPDYYKLFEQAYADGARLHNDSWGDPTGPADDLEAQFGGYPYGAQRTDKFVWDHPDMAIFFAAGNSGIDGVPGGEARFCADDQGNPNGDGVIDPDSLLAPGTAKNVITVGASEGQSNEGGGSQVLWVDFSQKFCLSAEPIATDTTADDPNGMAAFSSRGPADDGRSKPDLVAPGTNLISNRSHYPNAGTLWGGHSTNQHYAYGGGTSMATPLVAGAGALVRQWLGQRGFASPSAALLKAVLLNTTRDIAPGQYGTGAAREIPATRPNHVTGWGRADLGFLAAPPPYLLWADDHSDGLETGETVEYAGTAQRPLDVINSSQPLRIMLAWSDPPASLSAARQLVNDLDLTVIGPGNVVYRGNGGAGADRLNNVEGVIIDRPAPGRYTVRIGAYNVPVQRQPYALVVAGALSNATQLSVSKQALPASEVAPGGLITYTLALSANRSVKQPVTLSDPLPAHTAFVRASDGGKLSNGVVAWNIPSLTAGDTIWRTLVVRVAASAPPGQPIINGGYQATSGAIAPAAGAPVSVVVKRPVPAGARQIFVPLARR